MAEYITHNVTLTKYKAKVSKPLCFGACGSRGIEQLDVTHDSLWDNFVITATFVNGTYQSEKMIIGENAIDVPSGATATETKSGAIIFEGTTDGRTIYTVDIPFVVLDKTDVDSNPPTPDPEPTVYEQFIAQVKSDSESAKNSADTATTKAEEAKESADSAESSKTSAAESAKSAADELVKVQEAGTTALDNIKAEENKAVTNIQSEGNAQIQLVKSEGEKQVSNAKEEADKAAQSATEAEQSAKLSTDSAGNAAKSESNAKQSAVDSKLSETNAKSSETVSKENADSANEFAKRAETANDKAEEALLNTQAVAIQAIVDIGAAKDSAILSIQDESTTQFNTIQNEGAEQIKAIQNEGSSQVEIVQTEGEQQTAAAKAQADAASQYATAAGQSAESSQAWAGNSEFSADAAATSAAQAKSDADSIHGMTAEASTLEAGSAATAEYDTAANKMKFGIPRGSDASVTEANIASALGYKPADPANYTLSTDTGHSLDVSIDPSTYIMTMALKNPSGAALSTQTVDLPLESMVVKCEYDSATKELIITLQNGSVTRVSVADLVSGLATEKALSDEADRAKAAEKANADKFADYRTSAEQDTIDSEKQDTIADLSDIRAGAELGATALQEVPDTYRTSAAQDEVDGKLSSRITILENLHAVRYGIKIDMTESDPDARVSYLFDAEGMNPAGMDFDNAKFDYGDWADAWFVKNNHPCMVNFDGSVDYRLNPNDYSQKEDGGDSDFFNADYLGNAMSEIPLIWFKRYTSGNYVYKIFSPIQYDDDYVAYPFVRPNGSIAPALYYPMVKGSLDSAGRLRSIGGVNPQSSTTAAQEKAAAQLCGAKWGLVTWQAWNLLMDMQELISKNTDRQTKFGRGHESGGSSASDFLTCGSLSAMGQFFGHSSSDKAVKTFHIENPYAERWDRLEGMTFDNGIWKVKDTIGIDGYNFNGTGYTALSHGHPSGSGYVVTENTDAHGSFPLTVGGSTSTYWCDRYYQSTSGIRVPFVGGSWNYGAHCGRCVRVATAASDSYWNIGASPFLQNPS